MWGSLLVIMGCPEAIGDERYSTREARREHAEEVSSMVSEWTSSRTKREVMEAVNEIGVLGGAGLSTTDVLEDPHLGAREMVTQVDDPQGVNTCAGVPDQIEVQHRRISSSRAPRRAFGRGLVHPADRVQCLVNGLTRGPSSRQRFSGFRLWPEIPS